MPSKQSKKYHGPLLLAESWKEFFALVRFRGVDFHCVKTSWILQLVLEEEEMG
jgi:hypothetical protein